MRSWAGSTTSGRSSGPRESVVARDVRLEAAGELRLEANDDLALAGERILLNTDAPPMAPSWDDFIRRISNDT